MTKRFRRHNARLLGWLKAAFVGLATTAALIAMSFVPLWGALALGTGCGLLTFAAIDLGILAAVISLSLPITAADPMAGMAFLVLGIITIRYLGADGGRVFLIIALALAGASTGSTWAVVAIAGYLLGTSEGALAAAVACASLVVAGLLTGRAAAGATFTGGSEATRLLAFGEQIAGKDVPWPETFFSAQWLAQAFGGFNADSVQRFVDTFAGVSHPVALVAQPGLWALGAVVAGVLVKQGRRTRRRAVSIVGAGLGALVPALGAFALNSAVGLSLETQTIALQAALSAFAAIVFVGVAEWIFPLEAIAAAPGTRPLTMAAEDADVDELLRLIASAEERLTTEHTTNKVVMITDMKSFSRMTEEDGSILTAKAIQKHRDLLLPIIEKHGGHGKSTGGDGLVAAFDTPEGALVAAAEMQRALDAHNTSHPDERQMTVRIGVADGEVVLDKRGRPFIGAALNLAARVMNLADGGQAFVTAGVVSQTPGAVTTAVLGEFELKNIAMPVRIAEILWAPGQQPVDPKTREG